jgi:hypothetical protein
LLIDNPPLCLFVYYWLAIRLEVFTVLIPPIHNIVGKPPRINIAIRGSVALWTSQQGPAVFQFDIQRFINDIARFFENDTVLFTDWNVGACMGMQRPFPRFLDR